MQTMVGGMISLIMYALFFFAVHRLFVISNELSEIKELLKRRHDPLPPPAELQPAREWTVLDTEK